MTWHPEIPKGFRNKVVLGDAMELSKQIPDESIDLIILDPPYNVGKNYGKNQTDNLSDKDYLEWYSKVCEESFRVLKNGYLYVSCTVNQLWTLRPLWEQVGFKFQILLIWHGPNHVGGKAVWLQWNYLYEPIMLFLKGKRIPMINKVWGYKSDAIMTYARPQRNFIGHNKRKHICQKPLGLYKNIIARTPGEIILDYFVGSGTTAMAAKSMGRNFIAFEIIPETAEIAHNRILATNPPLFTMPQEEQQELLNEIPPQ